MLIASLQKLVTPTGAVAYCATDPIDGEMLTRWHDTILQVDHELEELDKHWGILLACYRGESDVPLIISDEKPPESDGWSLTGNCTAIPCR